MGAGLGLEIVRNLPTHRIWTLPVHVSEELRKLESISDKFDLSGNRVYQELIAPSSIPPVCESPPIHFVQLLLL